MCQCMANMKRKVGWNEDFDEIEEDYDVARLANLLKKLSYAEVDAKYIMEPSEMRHRTDKSLNNYYFNRFKNLIKVIES